MHLKKIENILSQTAKERYEYFIRKVSDFEQVWGLYNDGWATAGNNEGQKGISFWPEAEFAELCATDKWSNYEVKEIKLDVYLRKWLVGMHKDGIDAIIFSTPNDKGVFVKPDKLLKDINEELEQYE